MLTEYIKQAMRKAHYELMENGRFFATIPKCRGLWAEGTTLETCREELRSTLEDWLLLALQLGHELPVIGGINLNRTNRKSAHAQTR
jgi:predicted RNase H-like HicB family nuclease